MKPTESELAILRVLWTHGPATVREIHDHLARKDAGYTTTLKFLQIMTGKGLVRRDESNRSHIYRAAASQTGTRRRLLRDLIDRAFDGSMQKLVLHALSAKPATRAELKQIRALLDELDRKN